MTGLWGREVVNRDEEVCRMVLPAEMSGSQRTETITDYHGSMFQPHVSRISELRGVMSGVKYRGGEKITRFRLFDKAIGRPSADLDRYDS